MKAANLPEITSKIIKWGEKNIRSYPWRNSQDPYRILIAELLLHRTNADQVKRVYTNFLLKYPDFESIAESRPKQIEKDLSGLGLRWRARSLHKLSDIVTRDFKGVLPLDRDSLLSLPGIGEYTASAVISFSQRRPMSLLDTNIVRIIGRISGLRVTDSSRRDKRFKCIVQEMVNHNSTGELLFSLIDFGAKVCKSRNPDCLFCPIRNLCQCAKSKEV
ncbi:MAG: DNA glycosylase [Thermoplasmatales archaeon]|nr:DNA glycosylase [Thermoplasmatales archaeon]